MFAFVRASEGLLVAHLSLAASFLVGSSIFPWCERRDVQTLSSVQLMIRVVATCGFGLAILGFVAFLLGLLGLLTPATYWFCVLAIVVGCAYARGLSPLSGTYWRSRGMVFAGCWDTGGLVLYLAMVVLAFPAIIGNTGGSDPVAYHLVYAYEWAKAGRLVIDPFLRLPFYANNFVLLFSILMAAGGAAFVNFLSWGTALLTALGVYAACSDALSRFTRPYAVVASVALSMAVIISPAYLRWMDTAYVDTAIGAFGLMAFLGIRVALDERRASWLFVAAVTAGFLIGMKASFIALFPVFAVALFIAARSVRATRGAMSLVLLVLLVAGMPWYARNVVMAGDPVPPIGNLALHGRDGLMTKGEWHLNAADLSTPKTPAAILALPVSAFLHAQGDYFREYGVSALIVLLYVPIAIVVLLFLRPARIDRSLVIAALLVTLLAGYWAMTSSLLRYASLFYPLLAVSVALAMRHAFPVRAWSAPLIAAVCILTVGCSPGSAVFLKEYANSHLRDLPSSYLSEDFYMSRFSDGYMEARFVTDFMHRHHLGGRVYLLGLRSHYDFDSRGVHAIGDWIGAGGYYRLFRAVDARRASDYLRTLKVSALIVAPKKTIRGLEVPLERQLLEAGFCKVPIPGSAYGFYVDAKSVCGLGK